MSEHTDSQNTEQGAELNNQLRQLPFNTKEFEACGYRWYVEESLSINRYKSFQKMEIELGFTVNFSKLFERVQSAFFLLNERKDAEAAVVLHSIMEGVSSVSEKKSISLYVATLFINRADENRGEWSESIAKEKLNIWGEANIEAGFFLVVALNRVQNFNQHLKEVAAMMEKLETIKELTTENPYPFDNK